MHIHHKFIESATARVDPEMNENTTQMTSIFEMLHKSNKKSDSLAELLAQDENRFGRFSRSVSGLLLDYSRVAIAEAQFDALMALARSAGVEQQRDRMFAGEPINGSENRAVLHPLWRSGHFRDLLPADESESLSRAVGRMLAIAADLNRGILPDSGGKTRIRHLVHIGIGGSLLGPRLLCEAFPPADDCPRIHFLSSVDAWERERLLARIDPAETVVVLVSKSFTTSEVFAHADRLKQWQSERLDAEEIAGRSFAVTAAVEKAESYGVPVANILQMGSWTGGRFSLWSPVGLTAAISMGPDAFFELCSGGAAMDRHFRETALEDNLPVILGMLSVWHRNICGHDCEGLIPYDGRLRGLPGWLQQVEMESNGKSVDHDGEAVRLATTPIVFGDCGTDAQHALFQAFHQGTTIVPLEFIGVVRPDHGDQASQAQLLSHLLAQATALAVGRDAGQTTELMRAQGVPEAEIAAVLPHRVMPGNRPSSVILVDELTPVNLGKLLVLYEHKVFVESVIWDINAFDQWGVELGKVMAGAIEPALAAGGQSVSTGLPGLEGLLGHIRTIANR
jgi:glucose-6-phosphate isomerase